MNLNNHRMLCFLAFLVLFQLNEARHLKKASRTEKKENVAGKQRQGDIQPFTTGPAEHHQHPTNFSLRAERAKERLDVSYIGTKHNRMSKVGRKWQSGKIQTTTAAADNDQNDVQTTQTPGASNSSWVTWDNTTRQMIPKKQQHNYTAVFNVTETPTTSMTQSAESQLAARQETNPAYYDSQQPDQSQPDQQPEEEQTTQPSQDPAATDGMEGESASPLNPQAAYTAPVAGDVPPAQLADFAATSDPASYPQLYNSASSPITYDDSVTAATGAGTAFPDSGAANYDSGYSPDPYNQGADAYNQDQSAGAAVTDSSAQPIPDVSSAVTSYSPADFATDYPVTYATDGGVAGQDQAAGFEAGTTQAVFDPGFVPDITPDADYSPAAEYHVAGDISNETTAYPEDENTTEATTDYTDMPSTTDMTASTQVVNTPTECPEEIESLGCFKGPDNATLFPEIIMNRVDDQTLEEFLCACANEVLSRKWYTFALEQDVCYSGPDESIYDEYGSSNNCFNQSSEACSDHDVYCQGGKGSSSVYSVITPEHPHVIK